MESTLIVARMSESDMSQVRTIFTAFDDTDMPGRMGTVRRQLFHFHGLYFHLQDFAKADGRERVEAAKEDPAFIKVSEDLRSYIEPYDPGWQSPKDAMANSFYSWKAASV